MALYTSTRSSPLWQASLDMEPGRPWVDLEGGVFHRLADEQDEMANKRAGTIAIPERLPAHMRRWKRGGKLPGGKVRKPQAAGRRRSAASTGSARRTRSARRSA